MGREGRKGPKWRRWKGGEERDKGKEVEEEGVYITWPDL